MARITVRPVGRRAVGKPHCVICGSTRTLGLGVCANLCHWILEGWIGYNAVLNEVKFFTHKALPLAQLHSWDPTKRVRKAPSFTKLVAAARALGWSGNTASGSQPTFIDVETFDGSGWGSHTEAVA